MIPKKTIHTLSALLAGILLTACLDTDTAAGKSSAASSVQMMELNKDLVPAEVDDAYRTTYEIFVRSFCDSDGDGIGDLQGVISKLDYIQETGFNEIWLMPVCPSNTYHKYDVNDYKAIDPEYGTMEDFDQLIKECDARGIRVITDLVLNHTSVSHEWFLKAKEYLEELPADWEPSAEYCPYFDYFIFSRESRDGFAPLEGTNWYYEARFWSGMPDLNLDNENVRNEIKDIMKFWLDHGVYGFRLDAVTSYYTGNHEKNIEFLRWLVSEGKSLDPDCYFVAEGWDDRSVYAQYYASGIDSMFDFSFSGNEGAIAKILKGADAKFYAEAQVREQDLFSQYSDTWINAPFYTNHDMARSAGYYGADDGSKTKMAGAMNLLMSGNAFVYYGEELGMKGSGKDENKRAPMYWSADPEEAGMCDGPPDMDEVRMVFPPYAEQKDDPLSVYNYFRQAVLIRNAFPAIARGEVQPIEAVSGKFIGAYVKHAEGYQDVVIVINTGDEEETVDAGALPYTNLAAVLNVSEDVVTVTDTEIRMPAHGIAVFTE